MYLSVTLQQEIGANRARVIMLRQPTAAFRVLHAFVLATNSIGNSCLAFLLCKVVQ